VGSDSPAGRPQAKTVLTNCTVIDCTGQLPLKSRNLCIGVVLAVIAGQLATKELPRANCFPFSRENTDAIPARVVVEIDENG